MKLTDTHCHLDFDQFKKDRDSVLDRAWKAGLVRILIPGVDIPSSQAAVELAETDPRLFAAIGVHPNSTLSWDSWTLDALENLAKHPKVVAIGEIGLDYYRNHSPHIQQKRAFRTQLNLASQLNLPVVIHTRNASPESPGCMADTLEILTEFQLTGVLHSFSGNVMDARRVMELGFYIGVTGPITFKNAEMMRSVVASVPMERILIETDAPFLTPHPYRGKRNQPAYVQYVAEKISEVINQSPKFVAETTTANARRLFGWS